MASSWNPRAYLIKCTNCYQDLNTQSKTFPCHHSFCQSCLDMNFKGQTVVDDGNCPKCKESIRLDQLSLSSSCPSSVRGKAFKQKSEGPTLDKEIDDLEMSLRKQMEKTRKFTAELNVECDSECRRIWDEFEEMKENSRQRREELCEEMRRITNEQVKKWRHLLEETEKILKQLDIWRKQLHHLLHESQQNKDVKCDLQTLGSKLSSELQRAPIGPGEKCHLKVTFSSWWPQLLHQLKEQRIGSVSLTAGNLPSAKKISIEKEWNLLGLNMDIRSIQVCKEDHHLFLCEWYDKSIMEFNEEGSFVDECVLNEELQELLLHPWDFCLISPNTFVVLTWGLWGGKCELIYLERRKHPPFLEIKNIIETGREVFNFPSSLSHSDEILFICDEYLNVDSFSKDGQKMKTFKIEGSGDSYCPRIRVDPTNGNLWLSKDKDFSSELFCFNQKGQEIQSIKVEEVILDFCFNEVGDIYFCNFGGIFSIHPEQKILYKFEKKSEVNPKIFVLENRIYVYLCVDGKDSIQIFKIFN